jgi:death-on-curing protein
MMRYLTYSELIFINGKILNDEQIMAGKQKVRDIDLLLAAEARPQASAFGADAYPTLREKAAALMHSIARNHPFKDGNKRTATVAMLFMLEVNGQRVLWQPTAALAMIVAVAEGVQAMSALAEWLMLDNGEVSLEPDLDRDTQHIDQLLLEHRWLLNELAGR